MEHEDYTPKRSGKQHNVLPLWGNEATMNLNPLILANIQGSSYFKGFMYIRYTQPPGDLYDWYEDYLLDEEEIDVKAGGGQVMTIGQMAYQFLTKLDWFSTLFPRIPVPIQKQIERKLNDFARDNNINFHHLHQSYSARQNNYTAPAGGSGSAQQQYTGNASGRYNDREKDRERERNDGRGDVVERRRRDDREFFERERERERVSREYYGGYRDNRRDERYNRSKSRSKSRERYDYRDDKSKHKKKSKNKERDRSRERERHERSTERHRERDRDKRYH